MLWHHKSKLPCRKPHSCKTLLWIIYMSYLLRSEVFIAFTFRTTLLFLALFCFTKCEVYLTDLPKAPQWFRIMQILLTSSAVNLYTPIQKYLRKNLVACMKTVCSQVLCSLQQRKQIILYMMFQADIHFSYWIKWHSPVFQNLRSVNWSACRLQSRIFVYRAIVYSYSGPVQ